MIQIRLAYFPIPAVDLAMMKPRHGSPTVYLANQTHLTERLKMVFNLPALLVSYVFLKPFLENLEKYKFRNWVLDSGAFSAYNSGKEIRLEDYIETCKKVLAMKKAPAEIFALDVIGDWKASLKNTETMWKAGIQAIPCYHEGEPESALLHIAKSYPKIALGGVAKKGAKRKKEWASRCFARVWPKKIHGFGFGDETSVMTLPFDSVDSTSWELGPCAFGNWRSFGKMSVRGSKQNLQVEINWYLDLESRARQRWKKTWEKINAMDAEKRV